MDSVALTLFQIRMHSATGFNIVEATWTGTQLPRPVAICRLERNALKSSGGMPHRRLRSASESHLPSFGATRQPGSPYKTM